MHLTQMLHRWCNKGRRDRAALADRCTFGVHCRKGRSILLPFAMSTRAQEVWNKVAVMTLCDEMQKAHSTIDNVHIQKLCFLSELKGREQDIKSAYYRFFRYNNGPYSKALANDVTALISGCFVDPESGALLDRGRYLYTYIKPDLEESELASKAIGVIRGVVDEWKGFKDWSIVDEVYKMTVPVDALSKSMLVKDIPLKTDILIPERSNAKDIPPFSPGLIADIESELTAQPVSFDPASSEFQSSVRSRLEAALR
jgi:uncharacterized protein YwgA